MTTKVATTTTIAAPSIALIHEKWSAHMTCVSVAVRVIHAYICVPYNDVAYRAITLSFLFKSTTYRRLSSCIMIFFILSGNFAYVHGIIWERKPYRNPYRLSYLRYFRSYNMHGGMLARGLIGFFFLLLCHPCIMTDPRASLTFQATWPFIFVCCCGYSTKVTGWGFAQLCKGRPECKLPYRIN